MSSARRPSLILLTLAGACNAQPVARAHQTREMPPTQTGSHQLGLPGGEGMAGAKCSVVPMELGGPRPTIEFALGQGPALRAVFDTGAMANVVNIRFAKELGLANEGPLAAPFDRAGHPEGYQSTLRGARIGALKLPALSVPVMPSPLPNVPIIVSPNAFKGSLVSLDFAAGELRICPKTASNRPAGEGYAYSNPPFVLPTLAVRLGGQTINAHLDTGSRLALILPTTFADRVNLVGPLRKIGMARTHNGEQPIYSARVRGPIAVGPIVLTNPEVAFSDLVSGPNVGMELLRRMVVTLDPEAKRAWAVAARSPQPQQ